MDKNQRHWFWRMVMTGYTVGSLACMLITYIGNIITLPYVRAADFLYREQAYTGVSLQNSGNLVLKISKKLEKELHLK